MHKFKNAAEIFRLLEKSNCKKCGELTCLAFAGSVFLGQRKLQECPKLTREILERFVGGPENQIIDEHNPDDYLQKLKSEMAHLDLLATAKRVGALFSGNKLTLKVLGKDFSVDTEGNLFSDIHINPWVAVPFLIYLFLKDKGCRFQAGGFPFGNSEGEGTGIRFSRSGVKNPSNGWPTSIPTYLTPWSIFSAGNRWTSNLNPTSQLCCTLCPKFRS